MGQAPATAALAGAAYAPRSVTEVAPIAPHSPDNTPDIDDLAASPFPLRVEAADPPAIIIDGERWLTFGGCDYLGLSRHPQVLAAARAALDTLPLSTTASRTTTGNSLPHERLERELREFLGAEDVLLCPDGYTANLVALQALAAGPDPVVQRVRIAERSHASLTAAARCAGLAVEDGPGPVAVLTDGVFTADGRLAPVPELLGGLGAGDLLVIDDCHGFTTLGSMGRGSADHHGVAGDPRVIVTCTLAKGLGVAGGFVAGPGWFIERARTRASAFVGTTPTSPVLVEAARAALGVVRSDSARHERQRAARERLHNELRANGLRIDAGPCPIAAFALHEAQAERLQVLARSRKVWVPYIAYPGGPAPRYVRLSVGSEHTPEQIDLLIDLVRTALG